MGFRARAPLVVMEMAMAMTGWLILASAASGQTPTWVAADPYRGSTNSAVFSVAEMPTRGQVLAITVAGDMLLWNGQEWIPHGPSGGTGGWGRMSYDWRRDVVVKVGSAGENYEWNGERWTQRPSAPHAGGGAPNFNYDVAFHEGIGRLVMYQHNLCNQGFTMLWDGVSWSVNQGLQPVSTGPRMAYDRSSSVVVLYGGMNATCFWEDWTWIFDGTSWSRMNGPGPGLRFSPALGFDPTNGIVVLFGGSGLFGGYLSDTWRFSLTRWQQMATAGSPPAREKAALAFDHARSRLLVFGGLGPTGGQTPNFDTWMLLDRVMTSNPATVSPGQSVTLAWNVPSEANRPYATAASLGIVPGIPLLDGRVVPLNLDAMFVWSFLSQAPPFLRFAGVLDGTGRATAIVQVPADPRLSGIRFFVGGVTVTGSAIARISNEERVTIQ